MTTCLHAVVGLAAASLLIAGCGGDAAPEAAEPTPTSTVSPQPSGSATTEAPRREKPEAVIRHWISLSKAMQNTGDTTEFRAFSADCSTCTPLADRIEEIYGNGGYVKTDGWLVKDVERLGRVRRRHEFRVEIESAPTEYVETEGGKRKHLDGGEIAQQFILERQDLSWRIVEVAQFAS
jgi:hypothetical protein